MSKRDKRLERARRNPKEVDYTALLQILADAGCEIRPGGKHPYVAKYPGILNRITIPLQSPLLEVYVHKALALIEEIEMLNLDEDEEE